MAYIIVFFLIFLSALFSGLTLGLMSLGPHELKRKMLLGNKDAEKIYKVRRKGNMLLVTLLLGNVAVNSTLAIFLGTIAPGVIAGLIATGLITIFGEIVPQAVFSRFAMRLGARTVWMVQVFLIAFYPIAKPISFALDKILGEELPRTYTKKEIVKIIQEHAEGDLANLKMDEERIARGALTFGEKKIKDVMTPKSLLRTLIEDEIMDEEEKEDLRKTGYSRFPVFDNKQQKVKGILYAYDLLNPESYGKQISQIMDKKVFYVNENEKLEHALKAFIKTRKHLFMVVNKDSRIVGAISIEDVIEEIIGVEIIDEFDGYDKARVIADKFGTK